MNDDKVTLVLSRAEARMLERAAGQCMTNPDAVKATFTGPHRPTAWRAWSKLQLAAREADQKAVSGTRTPSRRS